MNKRVFTYQLEKGSRKFRCPKCDRKTFVRYVVISDNSYAPEEFGRCDRESKCGYIRVPESKTESNAFMQQKEAREAIVSQNYLPSSVLNATLKNYNTNTFVQYLLHNAPYPMPNEMVMEVVNLYKVGTIGKGVMAGGLTLPFISKNEDIQAIQVKLFDKNNHTIKTNFLHSIVAKYYEFKGQLQPQWLRSYLQNDKIINCLFGEHLLNKYPYNPIALVEAPKTALYASLYFGMPQCKSDFLWLAVFNKSSLSYSKLQVLREREIVLFPDLNAYDDWNNKVNKMKCYLKDTHILVSNYLEHNADEEDKQKGLDLGDYLIRYDWRAFRSQKKETDPKPNVPNMKMKAYLDDNGRLYLKQSFMNDYTVYPSVKSFKCRECLPCFVSSEILEQNNFRKVDINKI